MSNQIGFERIVYLGDSLTDSGGLFAATSAVAFIGVPPLAAGYAMQFSNGAVYADFVPGLIGVEGGEALNFAIGGAQLLTDNTIGDILAGSGLIRPDAAEEDLAFGIDFAAQVERFLASPAAEGDLSATAVSIFIGLNDYNDFVPTSIETAGAEAFAYGVLLANTIAEDAQPLIDAGVGTIILKTNPLVDVFPVTNGDGPEQQLLAQAVDVGFNTTLRAQAEALEAQGVDVRIVDMNGIFAEVDADFASFGFRIFEEQVLLGSNGSGGINPAVLGVPLDQIGFFDAVHPTAAFHGILGAFEAESLTSDYQRGTDAGERLKGSRADDLILASGGDDKVFTGRGEDVALAGLGDDFVWTGRGADLIAGGSGDDFALGGAGADIIADGAGDDRAFGGRGADLMIDGEGDDVYFGQHGRDTFVFTDPALFGREGGETNLVFGGGGRDTLILRVADEDADLGVYQRGKTIFVEELGIKAFGVENLVIVEGTDLSDKAFYNEQFATADLWNFI